MITNKTYVPVIQLYMYVFSECTFIWTMRFPKLKAYHAESLITYPGTTVLRVLHMNIWWLTKIVDLELLFKPILCFIEWTHHDSSIVYQVMQMFLLCKQTKQCSSLNITIKDIPKAQLSTCNLQNNKTLNILKNLSVEYFTCVQTPL